MVYNSFNGWLSSFLVFTGRCVCCGEDSLRNQDLCIYCEQSLPWLEHSCVRCAVPLTSPSKAPCGECQNRQPSYDQVLTPFRYEAPIRQLITRFKHHDGQAYGRVLSELFCDWLARKEDGQFRHRPDYLMPVPLHWTRLWRRGFNQAMWLAHDIGQRYDIPCLPNTLFKPYASSAQQQLSRTQRIRNLRDVFHIHAKRRALIANKHIAIIDDVMTTGSTVETIAHLLKQSGAASVSVWVLARTPKS